MKTETIDLFKLEENAENPRKITDSKADKLIDSILIFPRMLEIRPIVIDDTFKILGGNMRFKALQAIANMSTSEISANLSKCPGYNDKTELERDTLLNYWVHWINRPVVYVINASELSQKERKEFIIKDNTGFGEWDWSRLSTDWDLSELENWGVDLPADWDTSEAEEQKEAEEDDFSDEDAAQAEARVKSGDIWQLGEHRLMCGDCTYNEMLNKLTIGGGKMIDLYLTDPPYNVDYTGKTTDSLKIKNDKMEDTSFLQFLMNSFQSANQFLKEGAPFYIWHADSEGYNFRKAVRETGWLLKQCLIWNKNAMVMGRQDYQWKHEPCLYGWKSGASHHWYGDRKQTTVIDYNKPVRNGEHPTMKPVDLFAYLIQNSTKEGDSVLDTFGGSGTTLIACEQLNRKCYMMELDPHYCDVIIARWEKLTGKEAVKVHG